MRRRADNSFPMAAIQSRVPRVQGGEERDGAGGRRRSGDKRCFEEEALLLLIRTRQNMVEEEKEHYELDWNIQEMQICHECSR
uniref:Uncharacterized protein n=1 Tax=Cucumis melo TaxID=3656 RepID=A0A9I9DAS6_CUCME